MTQPDRESQDSAIRDLLQSYECQPILFIGSGISRRYCNLPNWIELLEAVFLRLGKQSTSFHYFKQKYDNQPEQIGSALAELAFEWAWKHGRDQFPPEYFNGHCEKDIFAKHLACQIISTTPPADLSKDAVLSREIAALKSVRPHAVITTNYDLFLENLFEGYEPISGQQVLRYNSNSFGEIFHIHGDITNPDSIVLTEKDYNDWNQKKKYVSAKLLTYFAEHPVFVFGYSVGDSNVKSIIKDIAEILNVGGVIPNIYHVVWDPEQNGVGRPSVTTIQHNDIEYNINAIYTSDFRWVFDALKSKAAISSVNPKLIRALAARTLKIIRTDIPIGSVQVNYEVLEKVANETDFLPNLLGISVANNPNLSHPFTLSQIAKKLGLRKWNDVNKMILSIKSSTGIDLRSTDNSYHCRIKVGESENSASRKWSHAAVELFNKVKNNETFEIRL